MAGSRGETHYFSGMAGEYRDTYAGFCFGLFSSVTQTDKFEAIPTPVVPVTEIGCGQEFGRKAGIGYFPEQKKGLCRIIDKWLPFAVWHLGVPDYFFEQ